MPDPVERAPLAEPLSPAHRLLPRLLVRLGAATAWVACGKLLTSWFSHQPVLSLLAGTSITFVTASVLFGWIGLAVATLAQLIVTAAKHGLGDLYTWASSASYALSGAIAFFTFLRVPRLRRDFDGARTIGWFTVAAFVGGILSPIVVSTTVRHAMFWRQVATWSRTTIISLWVFAPPLIIAGRRWLHWALAPLPGEPQARAPRRIALVRSTLAGEAPQIVGVETRELEVTRDLLLGLLAVAAITVGKIVFVGGHSAAGAWWNFLYLVVLWWEARRLRMPGTAVIAALAGVGILVGATKDGTPPLSGAETLANYAQILAIWLVGVLLGYGAEREGRLLEELAELTGRLSEDLQRVVRALTETVEARDEYTGGHLQRVQRFALDVGRRLGLAPHELELLHIASTLHDIGKIAIPEAILNKPAGLDPEERTVIERHPEIGARMLERIDGLREAAPLVLHHQERWDGKRDVRFPGYPTGLGGEEIPLGARIIAVVDCFDAMTTDRPYRRALDFDEARERLLRERGGQFDPEVVDTFLGILDSSPWG